MASLRDPKLISSPRCQHPPTSHSYALSLVLCRSTTSSYMTCSPSRSRCTNGRRSTRNGMGRTTTRCLPETEADAYKHRPTEHHSIRHVRNLFKKFCQFLGNSLTNFLWRNVNNTNAATR